MSENPGRPATAAPPKPRRTPQRHRRHKTHSPFLHAHPLAKPGLRPHAAPAPITTEPKPEEKA